MRRRQLLLLFSLWATTSCVDLSVDPNAIGAIQFSPFPAPSIVEGDSLRDLNGVAWPLDVKVFDARGRPLQDEPLQFVHSDTLTTVNAGRFLVAHAPLTFASGALLSRLSVSARSLQSLTQSIALVPRPSQFSRSGTLDRDTIFYALPSSATDTSASLQVRLTGGSTGTAAIPSYVVQFRLAVPTSGAPLPATDTTQAFTLVSDDGRVSALDSTDASGIAGRRVRFRFRTGQPPVDSVRVLAQARLGSQLFPTVEWIVRVQPRGTQ